MLVREEQNAAHAASGYARSAGKPGVCIATSGPGATNLITGIATAYMDSIPLVAITGQVNSELLGRDVFQEADITGACEPFTKHSYLVKRAEDLPRVFKEAFHIASTGRPGPVLIDVPVDVQQAEIPEFHYPEKARDHRLQAAHAGPRDADPARPRRPSRRRSGPFCAAAAAWCWPARARSSSPLRRRAASRCAPR